MTNVLDGAGFSQRFVGAMFVDRLETAGRDANTHKLSQLRHPNTLATQIWCENARHIFRDVPTYTTLFLGQAAPVNDAAACRSRSCDAANS